jgi:FeS assembly protein IscX
MRRRNGDATMATYSLHDSLYWDDAYPIALVLKTEHPGEDPTQVEHATLHKWVIGLVEFADDPAVMRIEYLEQILAEWVELELR